MEVIPAYRRDGLPSLKAYGGEGIRTPGLLIANQPLSQLSYTPVLV